MRDGAVYSTGGIGKETHEQVLKELRIDEWGSVRVGGSENKSTLKKLAESLDVACLPTIGTVISSGTTPDAIFLDFLDCEVLFELELLERQYGETSEVARYTDQSAFGEIIPHLNGKLPEHANRQWKAHPIIMREWPCGSKLNMPCPQKRAGYVVNIINKLVSRETIFDMFHALIYSCVAAYNPSANHLEVTTGGKNT